MNPRLFEIIKSDAACRQVFGSNPVRFMPFDDADQTQKTPYATWYVISGEPHNTLSCPPTADDYLIQIDIFGETAEEVLKAATTLRNVCEKHGYITNLKGQQRNPDTRKYRMAFDIEMTQERT